MTTELIAICAATYKRPKMLAQLLESLSQLQLDSLNVHLIIADNDSEESARPTFEAMAASLPFPATYVAEPTRGLASVRNRLVAEARALDAAYIAFIDDDETADPKWLTLLSSEASESNASAIAGRQIRWLDADIPALIKSCFPAENRPTGKRIGHFSTANALIRLSSLEQIEGPFDTRLNLTGGEDSMLSARIRQMGGTIIHCNEAETYEYVPRSRANPKWILQRAFRSGTTRSKIVRWSEPTWKDILVHVAHSLGIIAKHGALMIPNAVTRRELLLFRVRCSTLR